MQQNSAVITSHASTSRPCPNHPDPDKFSGDKTKLKAFITQLRIKLQQNADHYSCLGQNTKQNQLLYAIFQLEGDAFTQVQLFVFCHGINLCDVATLEDLLEVWFEEVDSVGTAKHKIYQLYQANKDLEVFLNTFLVLAKKTKFDDNQTLDLLYEKFNNEFKNFFVTKKRQTNLDDLIKKLRGIDASMKIISQRKWPAFSTNSKPSTFSTSNPKPAYQQSSQPAPNAASSSIPSTASGTHARLTDVLDIGKKNPCQMKRKSGGINLVCVDIVANQVTLPGIIAILPCY